MTERIWNHFIIRILGRKCTKNGFFHFVDFSHFPSTWCLLVCRSRVNLWRLYYAPFRINSKGWSKSQAISFFFTSLWLRISHSFRHDVALAIHLLNWSSNADLLTNLVPALFWGSVKSSVLPLSFKLLPAQFLSLTETDFSCILLAARSFHFPAFQSSSGPEADRMEKQSPKTATNRSG